jgi:magnesium transporter
MDSVVDNYEVIDRYIAEDLTEIEHQVFGEHTDLDSSAIYRLKREVLEFRRAAFPLAEALRRFPFLNYVGKGEKKVLPFFRDVEDHLARTNDHVESYDRLLSEILSAHLTKVTVQQNEDMRRISAWVAMAAVPTMIAGDLRHELPLHARAGGQDHLGRRIRDLLRLLHHHGDHGRRQRQPVLLLPQARLAVTPGQPVS